MTFRHGPIPLNSPEDTQRLGALFAGFIRPGLPVFLHGDIGAGKTMFARALIQSILVEPEDVPSPTFTIVQTYLTTKGTLWHCDLYRLSDPFETVELGLDLAFEEAICLVEWPDRLGNLRPAEVLHLTFEAGMNAHSVLIESPERLKSEIVGALDGRISDV